MEKNIKRSLEEKVKRAVLPLVMGMGVGLGGCGTILHTERGGVWYDCNTSEDYPSGHPCDDVVKEYHAQRAASTSSSSSSSSSDHDHGGYRDRDYDSGKGGSWKCPTKR